MTRSVFKPKQCTRDAILLVEKNMAILTLDFFHTKKIISTMVKITIECHVSAACFLFRTSKELKISWNSCLLVYDVEREKSANKWIYVVFVVFCTDKMKKIRIELSADEHRLPRNLMKCFFVCSNLRLQFFQFYPIYYLMIVVLNGPNDNN